MPEQKKGDTDAAAPVPGTDARTVNPSKKRDNVQKPGPQEDTTLSKNNTLFYYFTSGSVVLFIAIAIGIFFAPQELFSSRGIDGDIESRNKKDSAAPMDAPPALKYVHNKEKTTNNDGVQSSTTAKGKAEKRARGDPSCYTLEAYSDTFVVTPEEKRRNKNNERNPMASSYYRCGTRLTDLDSGAVDRTIMELCKSSPTSTSTTAFPSLRVVLMGNTEVNAHTQQRDNVAAQRVPLTRLNDDYCDCLDGTDELQTNACSFAGAVAPLGRARWWRHVTANAHVKLYEEEENATEKRSARLRRRIGGPSLPLRCRSDPHVVIAPSRVNDGVVDCCDGSDESDPIVLKRWREAQSALEGLLERQGSIERSLYGANRTVAAALLEYEFSALLPSCHRVKTERLAAAKALHEIISKGHKLYEQRRASGWESYGKEFVGNQTKLLREMVDLRTRFEKTKQSILERMTEKQARTPMEAGVPKQEIEEMQNRVERIQSLAMRLRHMDRMLNYECLGKDFVFYPIVEKSYRIPAAQCIDTSYKATGEVAQRLVHQYDAEDGREGASTHVDNVSFFTHYVTPFLHLVGEQLITAEQATELLRLSGSLAPNETLNESSPGYKDMQFVQTHILGYWYPDTTEESLANFSATDPSGGAVLEAQMMIGTHRDDAEQMGGGFGQRLPHERLAVLRRVRRVIQKEKQAPSKDKARKEADGEQGSVEIVVPQQHNSPLGAAVHLFYGGTKCGFDNISLPPKQNGAQSMDNETDDSLFTHSYGRLVYVCAAEDGVLTWYRNGKCAHEILFGTPSECTEWVLRAAEEKLHRAEAAVQQEKQ